MSVGPTKAWVWRKGPEEKPPADAPRGNGQDQNDEKDSILPSPLREPSDAVRNGAKPSKEKFRAVRNGAKPSKEKLRAARNGAKPSKEKLRAVRNGAKPSKEKLRAVRNGQNRRRKNSVPLGKMQFQ
ncbi:MAG: hypothetical protein IJ244_03590 [Bacteroidaceae bacterium]|nr:hypothetical protein [Bacteroidaceae bacterium]